MHVSWDRRELSFKVVYYGPAVSGKTTNLISVHKHIKQDRRSEMVSLNTEGDRTLYFDFMQLELGKVAGFTPRVQLYTVPGQVQYEISRRLVLRGADGVVFVADSAPDRASDNLAAWDNLQEHLASYNLNLESTPVAIQLNKRDLENAVSIEEFRLQFPIPENIPLFEAVAIEGQGVFETMRSIIGQVIGHLQQEVDQAVNMGQQATGANQ